MKEIAFWHVHDGIDTGRLR